MADFCKQCSEDLFGDDYRDLAGLCYKGQTVPVLCEGCVAAQVDHTGKCVSTHCLKEHGKETK